MSLYSLTHETLATLPVSGDFQLSHWLHHDLLQHCAWCRITGVIETKVNTRVGLSVICRTQRGRNMTLEEEETKLGMPSSLLLYLSVGTVACFSFIFFMFLRFIERQEKQEQNNEDFKKVIIIDDDDEDDSISVSFEYINAFTTKRDQESNDALMPSNSTPQKWSEEIILISNAAVPFFGNENENAGLSKDKIIDRELPTPEKESNFSPNLSKTSCFKWPQDSSLIENIKQKKGGQVSVGDHLHSKIVSLGILRKENETQKEESEISKIEEAARACAHLVTHPKRRRLPLVHKNKKSDDLGNSDENIKDWRERRNNKKQRSKLHERKSDSYSISSSNEDDYEPKSRVPYDKTIKFIRDENLNLVRVF